MASQFVKHEPRSCAVAAPENSNIPQINNALMTSPSRVYLSAAADARPRERYGPLEFVFWSERTTGPRAQVSDFGSLGPCPCDRWPWPHSTCSCMMLPRHVGAPNADGLDKLAGA